MPVVALLLRSNSTNYYYGIENPEYKSGIDQSDVDLDWAHVCRQDSAPHVSHVALLLCSFEQAASQNGSDTRQCPLQG